MQAEFFVIPVHLSDCPERDSNALATRLEICCFRDQLLQGSYSRRFEETAGAPLGMSWNGALQFVLQSRDQIKALCKAILTAFAGTEVELRVEFEKKVISIRTRNADLAEIEPLLEKCFGLLK